MNNRLFFLCCLIIKCSIAKSQPIPIEVFGGNNYLQTNIVVAKPLFKDSKFGLLNVSGFDAYYDDKNFNGSVMVTEINYSIINGIGIGAGATYNSVSGLAPTLGASYNNFGKRHAITLAPAVSLSTNTSFRVILNVAYKPKLTELLNLYLSSNNLLTYRFDGDHIRGFQKLRLGLDYKSFQFGFGLNFDQFGAMKISSSNIGGFIRKEFH